MNKRDILRGNVHPFLCLAILFQFETNEAHIIHVYTYAWNVYVWTNILSNAKTIKQQY